MYRCELDHKENWAPRNWCFRTMVLENTLESPLDCKEFKPVNPKGNHPWIHIWRADVDGEAPILWHPDSESWLIEKYPENGKDRRQKEKAVAEHEMVDSIIDSVQFSCSVVSDSLRPHELQHVRSPYPSPNPGVHPNPCPTSWWCHPTISFSVVPFSSCPQSFPASGSFQTSELFASDGQSIRVSASAWVLPMNTQDWSPLEWTGWISLQFKGLSRVFSNTTVQKQQFLTAPHSSTFAWEIPWTEEPGRLQSMGSLRVGHKWAISLSLFTFMHWRRKWQPTPVFLPGESQGQRSLVGCRLWGRTKSDTTEAT